MYRWKPYWVDGALTTTICEELEKVYRVITLSLRFFHNTYLLKKSRISERNISKPRLTSLRKIAFLNRSSAREFAGYLGRFFEGRFRSLEHTVTIRLYSPKDVSIFVMNAPLKLEDMFGNMSSLQLMTASGNFADVETLSDNWTSLNHTTLAPSSSSSVGSTGKQRSLNDYLWIYCSPVIFVVGIVGNALTLAVMTQKRLRGTTTAVYMPVIAAFDTAALITGILPEWLEACEAVVFNKLHPWTCKLEKFTFYTTSDLAIWVLVLFTLDRLIAVCFPLKKNVACVPRRALIACAVIGGLCALKNVHVFWTRGYDPSKKTNCGRPQPFTDFELHVRPWIAFALINALPFAVLVTSNSLIIWTLAVVSRARLDTKTGGRGSSNRNFNQTTMMCLSASFAFLVCVTPSMITLIGRPYWSDRPNYAYDVAKAVSNQLAYLNHAINFFLYCLTGQKFRSELLFLVCRRRGRTAAQEEQQTWQTYLSADGRSRPVRKGVARGLDTVKDQVIQPLAPVVFKNTEF